MQAVVFHRFAYTTCIASIKTIRKMSVISFKTLTDKTFPHGCYRTLVVDKGSVFLWISVICRTVFINVGFVEGPILSEKCNRYQSFAWESVS